MKKTVSQHSDPFRGIIQDGNEIYKRMGLFLGRVQGGHVDHIVNAHAQALELPVISLMLV